MAFDENESQVSISYINLFSYIYIDMKKKDLSDRDILNLLLEAIDYSFLQTDGTYDKALTYPVIDKVRFIKKVLNSTE